MHSLPFYQESPDHTNPQPAANGRTGVLAPKLELIGEDETMDSYDLYDPYGDDLSDHGDMDMEFLEVELVRSKCLLCWVRITIQRNMEKKRV